MDGIGIKLHAKTPSEEVILPSYEERQEKQNKHKTKKKTTCEHVEVEITDAIRRKHSHILFKHSVGRISIVPSWIAHP